MTHSNITGTIDLNYFFQEPFKIESMEYFKIYFGIFLFLIIIQLWFRSDPDIVIFSFYINKWKNWRKQRKGYWDNIALPEISLRNMDHGQRIIVVGFNNQGPVCKKIMEGVTFNEFILTDYKCSEYLIIRKQVYEVQHCSTGIYLEYCFDRFIRNYSESLPESLMVYKNLINRPFIMAI